MRSVDVSGRAGPGSRAGGWREAVSARRGFLVLGAVAIAIGIAVLLYRGPGRAFVRGHVGDVAATMLVFALVSMAAMRATPGVRALVTMSIATAIEVAQVWFHARSTVGHLVLGSTFDPVDLAAYVVGVAVALVWDRAWPGEQRTPRAREWKAGA